MHTYLLFESRGERPWHTKLVDAGKDSYKRVDVPPRLPTQKAWDDEDLFPDENAKEAPTAGSLMMSAEEQRQEPEYWSVFDILQCILEFERENRAVTDGYGRVDCYNTLHELTTYDSDEECFAIHWNS
jgi:hypothetical protein